MSQVRKFLATLPDPIFDIPVTATIVTGPDKVEAFTGTFQIRRMPNADVDKLRVSSLDNEGKYSPEKSAGYRSRLIAACVTDEGEVLTEYEVGQWPDELVRAVFEAAQKVNGLGAKAKEEASKN